MFCLASSFAIFLAIFLPSSEQEREPIIDIEVSFSISLLPSINNTCGGFFIVLSCLGKKVLA